MKAMEECTINAAITGNYGMAMEAFALNPLIPSGESAKQVLDQLLLAHEAYLSQFASAIQHLKEENVQIKDPVVQELMKEGK